ncbi:MAG: hypothetical protein BRD31_06485 [Bacteroidetes bacterium QH_2_64_26]|nr:MAG: hypothetical protein BRD31_06485 [Bacteroidetes bacterium QH_2_64_26]
MTWLAGAWAVFRKDLRVELRSRYAVNSMVFAGKLLFNLCLVALLTLTATVVFMLLIGGAVGSPGLFVGTLALGTVGLTGATTLLSALVARAARQGPLLPVLALPLLIPLLISGVGATRKAILGQGWVAAQDEVLTLIGFAGATLSAAFLLFDYVWCE